MTGNTSAHKRSGDDTPRPAHHATRRDSTLDITTLDITTLDITTLDITTLDITTLDIKGEIPCL
jgi:hypothetical protein